MPRYSYRCNACKETVTVQHLSDETLSVCPRCNVEDRLTKLLTLFRTDTKQEVRTKTGDVTEEFIRNSRDELALQKRQLEKKRE